MISNQILQNTIEGLKAITRIDLCVMDIEGKVLASTFSNAEDYEKFVLEFVNSPADSQVLQGFQFFKVFDEHQLEFIILARGDSDDVYMIGKVASFQIQNLLVAYKERFDKDNFIKNLLRDNLLRVDIYNRSKKLHIDTDVRRIVLLIEVNNERDMNSLETVRSIYTGRPKDFITAVDEKNVIVVREVKDNETYDDLCKAAKVIYEMLCGENLPKARIALGTIVQEIKDVSRSYKEDFDEEALMTINKFFENSLNVSETSRQLYIHRNTLVYRLDKLQKSTGLDLRVFEDAITFKIALMVVKYMNYMETFDY